jgi:hypothetical protein
MAYTQLTPLAPADRIIVDQGEKRMPYHFAVPIWITLSVVAWSPLLLVLRAVFS